MSFTRSAAVAVAVLSLPCSATAGGPYRPFQSGLWSGGAYTDERTGGFSHCSAGVAYDSGINMFVVSTEAHGWWLGFTNPQWSLTPKSSTPVKLGFDGRPALEVSGTVPKAQLLLVPIPDESHLVDTFRRSSQLTVSLQERSFSLSLGGTAAMMTELAGCMRSSVALETPGPAASSNPPEATVPALGALEPPATAAPAAPKAPAFLPAPQPDQTARGRDAAELEEVRLATNFLQAAGLPHARLIDADKPAALASFKAVWKSDNAAGAVKVIPPAREVTGISIASDLISVDPKLCKGNFASARSRDSVDGGVVFRAVLSCVDAQNERTAQYFITPRPKGGFVVFAVIGNGGADRGSTPELLNRAAVQAIGPDD